MEKNESNYNKCNLSQKKPQINAGSLVMVK